MNSVILIGYIATDIKKVEFQEGSLSKFNLAVRRDYKDKQGNYPTDFIPVEVVGGASNYVSTYLGKGSQIALSGEIRIDSYKDNQGNTKTFTKVYTREVKSVGPNSKNSNSQQQPLGNLSEENFINDDDIPF